MAWNFSDEEVARKVIEDIENGIYPISKAISLLNQIINDFDGKTIARDAIFLKEKIMEE